MPTWNRVISGLCVVASSDGATAKAFSMRGDLTGLFIIWALCSGVVGLYRVLRYKKVSRDVKLMTGYFIGYPTAVWLYFESSVESIIFAYLFALGAPIWLLIGLPLLDATSDPEKAKRYRLRDKH